MAEYAEYMILGYATMAVILGAMVLAMVLRYRSLTREARLIEQIAIEEGLAGDREPRPDRA
ncbi:MAG: hypothetical protein JW966_01145 [Anaerolineae bacterium]|nr:hypothetical protein [Anaerolineae bacterium]